MIDQASAKTGKVQIVILGGGFGGVEAARYLDCDVAKRSDIEVILSAGTTSVSLAHAARGGSR